MTKSRTQSPNSRLVPHDIALSRTVNEKGQRGVLATVYCERRGCTLQVEDCAQCDRFARVEPHEAGYVLMCRSTDSLVPPEGEEVGEQDDDPAPGKAEE